MLSTIVLCLTIYDLCHACVTIDGMLVSCLTIIDICHACVSMLSISVSCLTIYDMCHAYCELHFSVNAFFFFRSVKRHDAC